MATKDSIIAPIELDARMAMDVRAGDTVRVWQKITERYMEKDKVKEKTRSQAFEGLVLARKHGNESGGTFTVRKVVDGIGVEKIFPFYAPSIEKVEILQRSKVHRAKLYHIRTKAAKAIRREMRNVRAFKAEEVLADKTTEVKKEETK